MTVEEFAEVLSAEIDAVSLSEEELTLEEARKLSSVFLRIIRRLKDFISDYSFAEKKEEVNFFKKIKPRFSSSLIYYQKIFSILSDLPPGLPDDIKEYYLDEFRKIKNYLDSNKDFFIYYKSASTLFDEIYFLRNEPDLWLSIEGDECGQNNFSTIYDQKLSRLLAYEKVSFFLIERIKIIGKRQEGDNTNSSITWTASKAGLIELLYALQSCGACNNGTVDVKHLAIHFENLFNVKLGNFYRTFQEIRIRKMSRTTFIDLMKEKLIKRMDDTDENPRY